MFGRTKETTGTGTRHGHGSLGTQVGDGGGWTVGGGRWTGRLDGRVRRGHGVGGHGDGRGSGTIQDRKWKGSNPPLNCAVAAV